MKAAGFQTGEFFQMQPRHVEAIVFSAKAAVAAVAAVYAYNLFQLKGAAWAAIAALLVIQPDLHSSFKASLTRVAANLAGAFGGMALLIATGHPLVALAISVVIAGLICEWLNAGDAVRPAFAAIAIVIFTSDSSQWSNSFDRVFAVVVGCACAMATGFLFDRLTDAFNSLNKNDETKPAAKPGSTE
jgi:uncharacterized membrane protein YgaE (UPF0421/DUF939 family)